MRLERIGVLLGARDGKFIRDAFGGDAHVLIFAGAPQAVMDDGIDGDGVAEAEAFAHVREEIGRVGHGLHSAGDNYFRVARGNGLCGQRDRFEAGAAHHIESCGGDGIGETTAQTRLARGVLAQAGSEDATHEALVNDGGIDGGAAHGFADDDASEIGRRQRRERALEFSDRRAHRGDDDYRMRFIVHGNVLPWTPSIRFAWCA